MKQFTHYYGRKGASGFAIPTGNDPYTFLKSLLSYPGLGTRIGNISTAMVDAISVNIDNHSIDSGLSFLKQVADAQRNHEMAFITQRVAKLRALGGQGQLVDQITSDLEDMKKGNIDYVRFIQNLNTVITSLKRYKTRVQAFNTTAISNIPQVRMVENLATTIGSFADSRRAMYYSQEEVIRQLAIKWLNTIGRDFLEEQMLNGIIGAKNIAAALALVTQQMARYIYDNRLMIERHVSKSDKKGKFADFKSIDEFIESVNKIDLSDFEDQTNMSTILDNEKLLQEVQQMYGIDYDKTIKANGRKLSKSASKEVKEIKQLLNSDPLLSPKFENIMNHITVQWHGKAGGRNKLSFENELTSAVSDVFNSHQHLGALNMGTDILLGYLDTDISSDMDNDPIANTLQRIAYRIQHEAAINNVELSSKIYLEEMEKLDDELSELQSGFVIHETTKNYNTLERGRWPQGMNSFSGREMKLTNYISAISSMGAITGINVKELALTINNLATDAIGAVLKEPLEHLLALFGGIIMFDDFALIGKEVTQGMQLSNAQSLHLYKLQDVYFPASIFLDATYIAFTQLENELLEGNGMIVEINVPTVNYYDTNGKPDYSYGAKFAQRWEGVRNFVEKNTKIHLHFAQNFLSLMEQLL